MREAVTRLGLEVRIGVTGEVVAGIKAPPDRRRAGHPAGLDAAIAIAKLFQKGASIRSALAFQFASTNLVWELGLVLWVLLGWQFTLAEFVGGLILIAIMWTATRLFIPKPIEEEGRRHAQPQTPGISIIWRAPRSSAGALASHRQRPGRTSLTTLAATGRCSTARSSPASCSPAS
jgi:hypothetical protein